jgi:hypothetical protein
MYAYIRESVADLSEGCALLIITRRFLVARPAPTAIGYWLYAGTVSGVSRHSEPLFTALTLVPWQKAAEQ